MDLPRAVGLCSDSSRADGVTPPGRPSGPTDPPGLCQPGLSAGSEDALCHGASHRLPQPPPGPGRAPRGHGRPSRTPACAAGMPSPESREAGTPSGSAQHNRPPRPPSPGGPLPAAAPAAVRGGSAAIGLRRGPTCCCGCCRRGPGRGGTGRGGGGAGAGVPGDTGSAGAERGDSAAPAAAAGALLCCN